MKASTTVQYDDAGNLTRDAAGRTMAYDAENRLVNFNGGAGQYSYDGDGRRVKKIDTSGTTFFVYNIAGQLIAEYTTGTPSGGGTSYLTSDLLGSTRVVTKQDGTVKARYDYLPFGEEIEPSKGGRSGVTGYGGADSTRQKFTQKERDSESGLDYFLARYYSSAQGRFTSPDQYNPIIDSSKEEDFAKYLAEPRNWNRYVYVWNNPFKYFDPSGEKVFVVTYTTGNSHGDDELRRSAETYAEELQQNRKEFNPETDTVIVQGVQSHQDLQKVFDVANSDAVKNAYGQVEQVTLFSHSGGDGPTFHDARGEQYQLIDHGRSLPTFRINWSESAKARFIGCNTSRFAGVWANNQGVTSYGYNKFAYFSASPSKMVPDLKPGGPVYLIGADYGDANGAIAQIKYLTGFGSVYPLIKHEKPKK